VPVASNDSEVGRQENRRVVIIVAPNDAMPL
jgi:OOP family OmpA-OmpF porin